ncbi:MAG: hypothetical protein MJZ40_01445 [Bacteroidaceae bacterium]|nr:hypothetical protein [Bacteroidaceae bacterium]
MKNLFSLLSLTALLCLLSTAPCMAGGSGSWTHYSRMTTIATGKGLVYSSTDPTPNPAYTESRSVASTGTDSSDDYVTHIYHIYAQPKEGSYFRGWYKDANCTQYLSDELYYKFIVNTSSRDKNSPSEGFAFAKFEEITNIYYSQLHASCIGVGSVAVSATKTTSPDYKSESQAEAQSGKPDYTYYLHARPGYKNKFDGWYSDAECTKLISKNTVCSYSVLSLSTNESYPMKSKVYARFIPLSQEEQFYELGNSGFEQWESVSGGQEPKQWSSFLTATGSMAGMVKAEQLKRSTDAHSGQYSAQINARSVMFGIIAQGNLTTGCINGGSTSATDASGNYNYTNEGTGQAMRFTGRPDAMKVWIKSQCSGTIKIAAMLHAKGYYQDPNTANTGQLVRLVGQAAASPASNGGQWREYTVPFSYTSNDTNDRPYYALVSFATNSTPGKGSASDVMYVDDIKMVYNSELASVSMNGKNIKITNGKGSYAGKYDASKLACTLTGAGASYTAEYNEESSTLLITVYGDNYMDDPTNMHEYSIHFGGAEDTMEEYPINFDSDAENTRTDRTLETITLQEEGAEELTLSINPSLHYNDLTDVIYSVSDEGKPLKVNIAYKGSWMHSYAYIDLDKNGYFDTQVNTANHTVEGELMAYSFYSFGDNPKEGYNSLGEYISDDARDVIALPSFNLPTDPGQYRMRLKVDWNSIDPAGSLGNENSVTGKNGILKNAGYIVDFMLEVVNSDPTGVRVNLNENENDNCIYDLQGRRISAHQRSLQRGMNLQAGKKVIR